MTRRPFGGTTADFVEQKRADGTLQADPGATCTFFAAENGGLAITDLQDMNGHAINSVTADGFGWIPPFFGPDDGTAAMWVSGGGSSRQLMLSTDLATRVAALELLSTTGANTLIPTAVKTANYTAVPNDFVRWDVTASSYIQTLPNTPADGTMIGAKIVLPTTTNGNTVTLTCSGGNTFNRTGGSTTLVLSLEDQAYQLVFKGGIWTVIGADLTLSQLDKRYDPIGVAAGLALVLGG